jgi:DNA repair exonuclease SbcCD ATPase subunit
MSNNSINGSPLYQSHSLSRSNTFTRMNVSPKCFGTSQYIHKEEHERECRRWQAKLDEAEEKFAEACVNNSDMLQIKAELNKKIVELEKNQRPLIEQNKRLSDRNRIIQQELKKVEEKLCHAQDDFLTLKDAYDRLGKENNSLKEQRAFPEKVKELDRYRNQVLEYSKCINALRQSGIEKDRRYDLLVQKFKRMKKCLTKRSDDDDRHSSYGSEGSTESSINLDTITEDIDEALEIDHTSFCYDHEVALKLNALAFGEEQILKEQLEVANTTINELQATLTSRDNMVCNNIF